MLTIALTAAEAETLLSTRLHWFRHSRVAAAPRLLRSANGYTLSPSMAQHVSLVGELVQFPRLNELVAVPEADLVEGSAEDSWPNSCKSGSCKGSTYLNPAVLTERYKLPHKAGERAKAAATKSSMAVAEFQGQYYKPTDLKQFGDDCGVDVSIQQTIGGDLPVAGLEAELDIEYIKAVAPAVPLTVVYNSQYSLLSWANQISSLENPPLVHSVSYGNDEKQQASSAYIVSCNTAFMKAGARPFHSLRLW